MKLILKTGFAFLLFFSISLTAQDRFGHINSAELLTVMPAWKAAEKQLETFSKQLDTQYKNKVSSFETKYKAIAEQIQKGVLSPLEQQTKEKEITDLQTQIQQFEVTAQQDIAKKREELLNPILDQAQTAIKDVAIANGFTYIFDTSAGSLLYFPEGDDVTTLVKGKLGI